ncbi:MAG TPA: hypothetical protein VLG46_16215 [Anaerolineae bacterium]|nr:hypothetical protein [Anaerolineae bacterium]
MRERTRWLIVVIFATAMAWLESATVVYLRVLVGRINPYQADPLPVSVGLGKTELVREAATLIMLLTAGLLAGRTWRSRLAYALITFGVWDIFYYIFLAIISAWPRSLLDWDILFLIPLPWWGPVLAPVLIALLMIVGGTLVVHADQPDRPIWPHWKAWALNLSGVVLALIIFMLPALQAIANGLESVRQALPHDFYWLPFAVALLLMAVPIVEVGRKIAAAVD